MRDPAFEHDAAFAAADPDEADELLARFVERILPTEENTMSTYEPVSDDTAANILGEGIHTGLRRGSDAPEAPALWTAIDESDQAWCDALAYAVWGLGVMGYAVCKRQP